MTLRQKKLGQNFLTDSKYVKIISNHIMALKPSSILEIGSGTGIITKELCRICDHVISYEIDIDLFEKTSFNLSKFNNLDLVLGDGFNFKGDYDVFVSNLPYSKSRQFINWASGEKFRAAIVTVQKEFFDKITSNIGCKNYRAVTVLSNITFDIMPLEIIPNTSFYPPPKVQSQIILLTRKRIISDKMKNLLITLFTYRGKTVQSTLNNLSINAELSEKQMLMRIGYMSPEEMFVLLKQILNSTEY